MLSPWHGLPPCSGAGLLHCRVRVLSPLMQVDQALQQLQPPSVTTGIQTPYLGLVQHVSVFCAVIRDLYVVCLRVDMTQFLGSQLW